LHPNRFCEFPTSRCLGGVIELDALRITGLDLGPFHLTAPVAAIPRTVLGVLANPNIAGFIGAGILSRFTVDWDYEGKITITISRLGKQKTMTIHLRRLV
jgi:hypothetical protein